MASKDLGFINLFQTYKLELTNERLLLNAEKLNTTFNDIPHFMKFLLCNTVRGKEIHGSTQRS